MDNEKLYLGYDSSFLSDNSITSKVELPKLGQKLVKDVNTILDQDINVLNYFNYSLVLSKTRKFPYYTAANIDGLLFKKAERATNWKKDQRAKELQWGKELYSAIKSDFDKGHMTKREDVQWGETPALAQIASDSTFYYSNAVPQHKNLNQKIWKKLEDYILHSETKEKKLKICLFTGPVLSENDPFFITPVNNQKIQLPTIFWKVIIYPKSDGKLYRVGFIMSQKRLLEENGIVEESELEHFTSEDELFMQFNDAATYQVNISLIEELSNLTFHKAIDSYTDDRHIKLVLNEVDINPDLESDSIEQFLGYSIQNLTL